MTKNISESRNLKIYGVLWCLSICYALLHHFVNQTHFARFPPMFNVCMEIILNGYIGQNLSNAANHAVQTGSSFPFLQYLYSSLYFITGLDTFTILLFPIGSILIPICFLIFIRSLFEKYTTMGLLLNIYLIVYTISFKYFRASYVDTFALTAFIIMLYCFRKMQTEKFHSSYSLIVLMMLALIIGLWHTMAFISVIFIISIMLLNFAINFFYRKQLKFQSQNTLDYITIGVFSVVFLVTFRFDKLTPYTQSFFNDGFDFFTFFEPFLRKLLGKPTHSLDISAYQYTYLESFLGKVYFYSNLLISIVAAYISVVAILYFLKLLFDRKEPDSNTKMGLLFTMSAIFSQAFFSILYSKTATGLFYVPYLFPVYGIYLLDKLGKKKMASLTIILLIILSFSLSLASYLTNENETTPLTKYYDTKPSFYWFYTHKSINSSVYADFSVLYKFLASEVQCGLPTTDYIDITSDRYKYIVGDSKPDPKDNYNYVLIDYGTMSANKPINTYENRGLLVPKLASINNNQCLNKVYLDTNIGIYQYNIT